MRPSIVYYNIPRACLLNRPPVPAMDLKSNKSGLCHHMLETCRKAEKIMSQTFKQCRATC